MRAEAPAIMIDQVCKSKIRVKCARVRLGLESDSPMIVELPPRSLVPIMQRVINRK